MTTFWYTDSIAAPDAACEAQALARQNQLTKPQGALGQLEWLAIKLAGMQASQTPGIKRPYLCVFAGDHGVTAEGVSAFPSVVTAEMVRNFSRGGAAVSVLAARISAHFEVINVGTLVSLEPLPKVRDCRIRAGTGNLAMEPAMSNDEVAQALRIGREAAERAFDQGADLFIAGEMGIGNTTAATALGCALLELEPHQLCGPGAGLDSAGVAHKATVIARALARQQSLGHTPLEWLAGLGGLEIAAMVGAYIRSAQLSLPVLVDGFISTSAALAATRINPAVRDWMLFGHQSAEPGHQRMLVALDAEPVLKLDMRLGEGSGAAMAVPILQAACALHNEMATFAEAAVSTSSN